MRFMILRKADARSEASEMPSCALMEAMGAYMQEMAKAGILTAADGLQASSKGARVQFRNGRPEVSTGPFGGAPEDLLAGFCIIQVASKDDAIEWAKRWPTLDGDGNVQIEIRQVFEADDFGPEFTSDLRRAEEDMCAEIARNRKG
jgi:hypothetical protein